MLQKVVFDDIINLYQTNDIKQHNPSNYVTQKHRNTETQKRNKYRTTNALSAVQKRINLRRKIK